MSNSRFSSSSSSSPFLNAPALPTSQTNVSWSYANAKVPAWAVTSAPTVAPQASAESAPENGQSRNRSVSTSQPGPHPALPDLPKKSRKRRKLLSEEHVLMKESAAKFDGVLASDRQATLHPEVDAPFVDAADVVKRLLPYHVWQHPAGDLEAIAGLPLQKGKDKLAEAVITKAEVIDMKHALGSLKRKRKLEKNFRQILNRPGTRSAPDDIVYHLEQNALDTERNESTSLTYDLRNARAELDTFERHKKSRASTPSRVSVQPSHPAPTAYPGYAGYNYSHVPPYPYTYAHPATSAYPGAGRSSQPMHVSTTAAFPGYAVAASSSTSAGANSTSQPSSSVTQPPRVAPPAPVPNSTAIPVQLPVSYLPALTQLGVNPVAAASLPAGAPRPACVMTGASQDGTTLALEINVGMLRPPQMNGLAVLLTSLVNSRTSAATTSQTVGSGDAPGDGARGGMTSKGASSPEIAAQESGG